ncbi:HE65A [Chrysodeixis includens nucleopolyhedrovirus]|uniref:HE65A n=1 Tax=Chrysodeixis includens nucleopolyhedrovirus TaxID=1207438 RepID=A0A5B8YTX8_9ABAC|nr:HE65A [Chrysodeixis includens nucleopolyhedrovirus]QED40591.1 HE65A [Chrysodeixis includens nucleopolyhedrovirus]
MVFIQLDIGSRAKGYSVLNSDYDRIIFTKCSTDKFLDFINNSNVLTNQHIKDLYGDCTNVDIYKGLMGIYTGKYYYLGVFAKQQDILNANGTPNVMLYKFIRKLTELRMTNILITMVRYNVKGHEYNNPKLLLTIMFNLAYIEHWLNTKTLPDDVRLPVLLLKNSKASEVYYRLMSDRQNSKLSSIQDTNFIYLWQEKLCNIINKLPPLENRYDIVKTIVMYMLNERFPLLIK